MKSMRCAFVAVIAVAAGQSFGAFTYTFAGVTNTSATNTANGVAQLAVTVDAAGPNQASFTFTNSGPLAMSITDIYFDDGTLLGIASIANGSGVSFSQGGSPPNLPGGNMLSPAFDTTAGFLADSNPPAQPNGVNPGEFVTITFDLLPSKTVADVVSALNAGTDLRIGIHVQGYANGGSESFVNAVPAPTALGLLGVAGVIAARRRRQSAL